VRVSPKLSILVIALVFLFGSCRSKEAQPAEQQAEDVPMDGFDPNSLSAIQKTQSDNLYTRQKLQEEAKWLQMRLKMVGAELQANQLRQAELTLSSEMSKYGKLNERMPDNHGFVDERKRVIWNARLNIAHDEYKQATAKVRLLQRDLDDYRAQLNELGVDAPENSVFTDIIEVAED